MTVWSPSFSATCFAANPPIEKNLSVPSLTFSEVCGAPLLTVPRILMTFSASFARDDHAGASHQ